MDLPNDQTTLGEARAWLRARVEDGATCPCCTQLAKVYRRRIHAAMARDLIIAARASDGEWFHVRTVLGHDGGDFAKLTYWGLIQDDADAVRDDGSTRTGWWQVTSMGVKFAHNRCTVPKYARIYDGRLLSLKGEEVTVRDCLGKRFNYEELMRGE